MEHRLIVAGIGPGSREYILPKALHAIESAKYLAGGRRALADFASAGQETYPVTGKLSELADWIRSALACGDVTVMVSGDPGFYSLLPWLKKQFVHTEIEVILQPAPVAEKAVCPYGDRSHPGDFFRAGGLLLHRRAVAGHGLAVFSRADAGRGKTGLPAGEETGVSHRSRT